MAWGLIYHTNIYFLLFRATSIILQFTLHKKYIFWFDTHTPMQYQLVPVNLFPVNNILVDINGFQNVRPEYYSGGGGGGVLPNLGMVGDVPRWWPPFWGFSIWLGPYFIPQHNPTDPLCLQKIQFVSITFSYYYYYHI